jgi:hypothetical protein
VQKVWDWIAEGYYWLLWYLGFKDKDDNLTTPDDREKITFMLRRMQQRMGLVWWILSSMVFTVIVIFALHAWWLWFLYVLLWWLYIHILFAYKPPAEPAKLKKHPWYLVGRKK